MYHRRLYGFVYIVSEAARPEAVPLLRVFLEYRASNTNECMGMENTLLRVTYLQPSDFFLHDWRQCFQMFESDPWSLCYARLYPCA